MPPEQAFSQTDDAGGQAAVLCELVAVRRALGELDAARAVAEDAVALASKAGDARLGRRAKRGRATDAIAARSDGGTQSVLTAIANRDLRGAETAARELGWLRTRITMTRRVS